MEDLLDHLRIQLRARRPGAYILGVTGGVAAGKTTFAERLAIAMRAWSERPSVEIVSTDGFLYPNAILAEKQLSYRKGFPESYNVEALGSAIAALRGGRTATVPLYSHVTYDVDSRNAKNVENVDVAIFDGLHLGRVKASTTGERQIDHLIYIDAEERAIESWFAARLNALMIAGQKDPASFYYQFREMTDNERRTFVDRVWNGINLPNLREHIVKDRDLADIVVEKASDHTTRRIRIVG
jgi:type I pantothenate kinase